MIRRKYRFPPRALLVGTASVLLLLGLPSLIASQFARNRVSTIQGAPQKSVAIVFGAGLSRNGSPSPVLRDRISTAADLYFNQKVEKLLMSGDNRTLDYNEPGAMKAFAVELGVPEEDIILDYAGRRTYDTCYRAQHIFGVTDALVVTQNYHIPRALMTCRGLGINAIGVAADRREYSTISLQRWRMREIPATMVAFWDVFVARPLPVLGVPEPIFPNKIAYKQIN